VAAYAVARLKGGGYQFDVMTREDVDKIRAGSKAKDDGPWASHYAEMARKTVLKRLCKYLPQAVEAQDAASLDDQVEAGVIEMDAPPAAMLEGKTADRAANLKNRLANASQVGGDMVDMETGEVIEEKSPDESDGEFEDILTEMESTMIIGQVEAISFRFKEGGGRFSPTQHGAFAKAVSQARERIGK
jgi:recombinational DNA repair protein RecT